MADVIVSLMTAIIEDQRKGNEVTGQDSSGPTYKEKKDMGLNLSLFCSPHRILSSFPYILGHNYKRKKDNMAQNVGKE